MNSPGDLTRVWYRQTPLGRNDLGDGRHLGSELRLPGVREGRLVVSAITGPATGGKPTRSSGRKGSRFRRAAYPARLAASRVQTWGARQEPRAVFRHSYYYIRVRQAQAPFAIPVASPVQAAPVTGALLAREIN